MPDTQAVTTPIPAKAQWSLFGINSDQWTSIATSIVTVLGTLLASFGLGHDVIEVITGGVMVAIALGVALWLNTGNVYDQIIAAVQKLLEILGVFAVSRGWLTNEQVAQYSGIVVTVIGMAWQMLHYSSAAGPNLAGSTIVDKPAS